MSTYFRKNFQIKYTSKATEKRYFYVHKLMRDAVFAIKNEN